MTKFIISFCAVILLFACDDTFQPLPQEVVVEKAFAKSSQDFAFDFLQKMESFEETNTNFLVSPLSLNMALGMLLNGSEGSSRAEILKTLHLEGQEISSINANYLKLIEGLPLADPEVTNTLANSIWQDSAFESEQRFKDLLKESFNAELYREDFGNGATVNKINNWASEKTNNKITKILESISKDQVMFLINALYFKGDWANEFDPKKTSKATFQGTLGQRQVDMMNKEDTFKYVNLKDYKMLELPYGSGMYSMVIILPNDKVSVKEVIKTLNTQEWEDANSKLDSQKVILKLPKFKMEYDVRLNAVLSEMGMPSLFTSNADLSGISKPAGKLKVGFVKQNTFLELDEKGTEAAAVTTIGIELTSLPNYPAFICDKPFLFLIKEKTSETIQFIGRIQNL